MSTGHKTINHPKNNITIGKIRGLDSTSTSSGVFSILAFDHRQSFIHMLRSESPLGLSYHEIVAAKSLIIQALAPHTSAVLLDPVFGAAQSIANGSLPGDIGLLVAVDETGYHGSPTRRVSTILEGWSVQKVKRMGADAVKLLVYYHPEAGELTLRQENLVSEVIEACRSADIAIFLEPVTYSIDENIDKKSSAFADRRLNLILDMIRRLGALGPEVLKLEFPVDVKYEPDEDKWTSACQAVSRVCPCPWTLLSAGVDFETFARQVEVACKSGASGFIGGRAIWQEGIAMPEKERMDWLSQVAVERLKRLTALANQYARPWREFFPDLDKIVPEGWYGVYEA